MSHGLGSAAGWGRLDDAAVVKVQTAVYLIRDFMLIRFEFVKYAQIIIQFIG